MRILMLMPKVDLGGVTSHIRLLAQELIKAGHQVGIGTAGGELLPLLLNAGAFQVDLHVYPSSLPHLFLSALRLADYLRTHPADILHSHHRFTTLVGRIASRWTGIPLVVTIHEFKANWRCLAHLWIGDVTIAPSKAMQKHLSSLIRIEKQRIFIIPNAVALGQATTHERLYQLRHELLRDPRALVVGCVGRLSPEKGVGYFLDSIPIIQRNLAGVEFLVIGSGPEELALKEKARLNMLPTSMFLGARDNVPELLEVLDILVIPSLSESFSMVALEAMRARKPVIGTAVGGIPEVVNDGDTGLLVPPGSSEKLARAILRLLKNTEERQRMGQRGRQIVEQQYSPGLLLSLTLDAYQTARVKSNR